MVGAEGDGPVEGLEPGFQVLAGDGIDEVEVEPGDSGGFDDNEAAGDIVGIVVSFESGEFAAVEALAADADAIDASGCARCRQYSRVTVAGFASTVHSLDR